MIKLNNKARNLVKLLLFKGLEKQTRSVACWSPLANTFNHSLKKTNLKTQLFGEKTGLFGNDKLFYPEGFYLLKENAIVSADNLVDEITSPNRQRKMVQIFDDLSDVLCQVADMAEFVRLGHPSKRFACEAEDACLAINNLVEKLNTNPAIYQALKNAVDKDVIETDKIDVHVAKLFLFDFEQSGIHLSESKRKKVVQLNEYILRLGSHFMSGSLQPRAVEKIKLPAHLLNTFGHAGDSVQVSNLYADSNDELVRELAYRVYLYPDTHQSQLLDEILNSRHELAQLCGFETFSQRAIRGSLVEESKVVEEFLDILSKELKPRAQNDFDQMLSLKQASLPDSKVLNHWDVPYYSSLAKQERFGLCNSDYKPYLSLGACMEGLNMLFQSIFGVTMKVEELKSNEVWHEDVIKLGIYDSNGFLGLIYCDFIERPLKPNQDCHYTIRGGRDLPDGTYQSPIVTLFLTLPSPQPNQPTLLTPSMMDNLFHEMGHAMHSMLARTKYQHVTGTRCPTDLAEVPSILMEYFASDPRVVSKFARHYRTGEKIPDSLLSNLFASKHFFSSHEMQLQVFYAALDQSFHGKHPLESSTMETMSRIQNKFYGLEHVPGTAWHLRFGHLVGYGAKYYAYLVSKSVASWIWHTHFQSDPLSRDAGEKYRKMVLAHGGSKPAKLLVQDFLNQDVTAGSLAQALVMDLDSKM